MAGKEVIYDFVPVSMEYLIAEENLFFNKIKAIQKEMDKKQKEMDYQLLEI